MHVIHLGCIEGDLAGGPRLCSRDVYESNLLGLRTSDGEGFILETRYLLVSCALSFVRGLVGWSMGSRYLWMPVVSHHGLFTNTSVCSRSQTLARSRSGSRRYTGHEPYGAHHHTFHYDATVATGASHPKKRSTKAAMATPQHPAQSPASRKACIHADTSPCSCAQGFRQ